MRILIFGNGTLDCADANCGLALRAMGHEVEYFDPEGHPRVLAPLRRGWASRRAINRILSLVPDAERLWRREFLDAAAAFSPALILIIDLNRIPADLVREAKERTGAKVVGWFQDA